MLLQRLNHQMLKLINSEKSGWIGLLKIIFQAELLHLYLDYSINIHTLYINYTKEM